MAPPWLPFSHIHIPQKSSRQNTWVSPPILTSQPRCEMDYIGRWSQDPLVSIHGWGARVCLCVGVWCRTEREKLNTSHYGNSFWSCSNCLSMDLFSGTRGAWQWRCPREGRILLRQPWMKSCFFTVYVTLKPLASSPEGFSKSSLAHLSFPS